MAILAETVCDEPLFHRAEPFVAQKKRFAGIAAVRLARCCCALNSKAAQTFAALGRLKTKIAEDHSFRIHRNTPCTNSYTEANPEQHVSERII
ncbi:hypothetical protein GCM10008941_04770 [Rhizomicrobium palustre]